jgi:hypothetical protein
VLTVGFVFTFRRNGDALEQSSTGKERDSELSSCGANGHADGTFFLSEQQKQ